MTRHHYGLFRQMPAIGKRFIVFESMIILSIILLYIPAQVQASSIETANIDVSVQKNDSAIILSHLTGTEKSVWSELKHVYFVIAGVICVIDIMVYFKKKDDYKASPIYKALNSADRFEGIPCDGNLDAAYVLAKHAGICEEHSIISLYLMKMIVSDAIELVPNKWIPLQKDMLLHPELVTKGTQDEKLMSLLLGASGGNRRITSCKMNHYVKKNYRTVDGFCADSESEGKRWLLEHDCLKESYFRQYEDLTENGRNQLKQLIGLYHYLTDLWEDQSSTDDWELESDMIPYAVLFNLVKTIKIKYKEYSY